MENAKQMRDEQQFFDQCQTKSEAFDMIHQRRSANYKPNVWKHDFLQSLTSRYNIGEIHKKRAEKLREDVMRMFDEAVDPLAKLKMIDSIEKACLTNLFEEKIKEALDTVVYISNNNPIIEEDLHDTALCFRLLRQHGYKVSQDIFNGFMDETGMKNIHTNVKGMLELFEASHLALEGENILDEAQAFSIGNLKDISSNLDNIFNKNVAHALELPSHWRVQWFDVRWQINAYEKGECVNSILLELARLNFNMVQATHQKELKEMSRWWRNLGLMENLSFTRDRLVESFLCALGVAFEPQYGCLRKCLTKVIILILIIDDVYDVYGTLEELEHFTNAVERWDSKEIQQLPECMKICFQALYNTTNEVADEIQKEKGSNRVLPPLNKAWADFCKALYVEAKWYNTGYTPSLQEYLSNGWISSSGPLLCVHAFLSRTHDVTEDVVEFLEHNQDIMYGASLIIRLCNDLGTSVAELERGDAPSSILCYMREMNVSEEIGRKHIKVMITKTWKEINRQCIIRSPLLQPFVNIITNTARVAHCIYQYGDGFGVQDREIRGQILSLLVEPFNLN